MEHIVLIANIVFVLVLLSGIVMTLMGFPGNILIVLTALAYGYYDHFEMMNYAVLVIVFGLFIIGEIIEFIAGLLGAKRENASKRAMFAPFIGTIIGGIWGTAILPIIGSLLGALVGAFIAAALAEFSKTKDVTRAKQVAHSVIKGQIWGIVIKAMTAVSMTAILIYQLKWQ